VCSGVDQAGPSAPARRWEQSVISVDSSRLSRMPDRTRWPCAVS
jgi:hypothetical protein